MKGTDCEDFRRKKSPDFSVSADSIFLYVICEKGKNFFSLLRILVSSYEKKRKISSEERILQLQLATVCVHSGSTETASSFYRISYLCVNLVVCPELLRLSTEGILIEILRELFVSYDITTD
jgi:hypothetical protein